jgi:aldehyde dehydrogenase (NAD+)
VKAATGYCVYNSGQNCNASSRLLVHRSIYQQTIDAVAERMRGVTIDDAMRDGRHIGPLANRAQYERVVAMIRVGVDEGARLVVGGAQNQ